MRVDPGCQRLIAPLEDAELSLLEASLKEYGVLQALVVWKEEDILLDGHNRKAIAERLGIKYSTVEISLPDRDAAEDWIEAHQLGRRNLRPDAFRLLLGRRYERAKKSQGGARQALDSGGQNDLLKGSNASAKTLASEHGVNEKTVRRAAKSARALKGHEKLERAVLSGEKTLRQAVKEAAPPRARKQTPPPAKMKHGIITEFVTHQVKGEEPVICPHFHELRYVHGCDFDCQWCYMKGALHGKTEQKTKPWERVLADVLQFHGAAKTPMLLNAGEVGDALGGETGDDSPALALLGTLARLGKHRVLYLTKTTAVGHLLRAPPAWRAYAVLAWSLNATPVAAKWELDAPTPSKRIDAARRAQEAGYEVRIRIDPIVPIDGWQKAYAALVDEVKAVLTPSRVTLGTLRLRNENTLRYAKDTSWAKLLSEKSGWGLKMPEEQRIACMSFVRDRLGLGVGVCKETESVLVKFGSVGKCNCEG